MGFLFVREWWFGNGLRIRENHGANKGWSGGTMVGEEDRSEWISLGDESKLDYTHRPLLQLTESRAKQTQSKPNPV